MDASLDDPGRRVLSTPSRSRSAGDTDLVRVEASVPLGIDASFALLTEGIGGWWPAQVSCAPADAGTPMTIEPYVDGRWGERSDDDLVAWGTVTRWEPPTRIGLTWAVGADRRAPARGPTGPASRVDVRLAPVADDLTTIIVEHRDLDAHDDPVAVRAWMGGDDGWWAILRAYVAAARA